MEFKKVNITLPAQLFEKSKQLIERGLYSNFSDLVRSSLRSEIKEGAGLLNDMNEWKFLVESIREDLRKTELAKLSKVEMLKRLKHSREKVYDENYA